MTLKTLWKPGKPVTYVKREDVKFLVLEALGDVGLTQEFVKRCAAFLDTTAEKLKRHLHAEEVALIRSQVKAQREAWKGRNDARKDRLRDAGLLPPARPRVPGHAHRGACGKNCWAEYGAAKAGLKKAFPRRRNHGAN